MSGEAGQAQREIESLGEAAMALQYIRHSSEAALTDEELRKLGEVENFLAGYTDDLGSVDGERVGFMDLDEDDGFLGIGMRADLEDQSTFKGPGSNVPGRYVLVRQEVTDDE